MKILVYIVCMLLAAAFGLLAQPVSNVSSGIRIIPRALKVSDDSVRIDLEIRAVGIRIPSDESVSLIPELQQGEKRVVLPSVVLSGAQRARFDRRQAAVSPDVNRPIPYHVWSGVRRGNNYVLAYQVSIPYASWMKHASLRLRQVGKDCCTEQLLAYDVLTEDINLVSPYVLPSETIRPTVVAETAVRKKVATHKVPVPAVSAISGVHHISAIACMAYAYGSSSVVDPSFGGNRDELLKVDNILFPLLENPDIQFVEIRITYNQPAGSSRHNGDALSASRSEGFRSWLSRAYSLQGYPLTIGSSVASSGDDSGCIEVEIIYQQCNNNNSNNRKQQ